MKKTVLVLLAGLIVFFSALPVFAVDLKFNGNFRVRGFYTENLTDQSDAIADNTAYNTMRFLLTTTASAGVATGVITIDFTSENNTGNMRFGEGEDASYGPNDDQFALIEAFLKADLRMAVLSAGRMAFKIGHGILFEDPVDGFFLDVPLGPAKLTLVNLKPFDCSDLPLTTPNPGVGSGPLTSCSGTGNDTDLYLANLNFRPTGDLGSNIFFGVYKDRGFNIPQPPTTSPYATGTSDVEIYIVGVTGDANLGPINLTAEVDYLTGDMNNNTANADLDGLNIQVGGDIATGPANVGLTLLYASGDDPNDADVNINGFDGNFPIGIILTNIGARSLAPKDGTCLSVNGSSLGGVPNCIGGAGLFAIKGTGSMSPVDRVTLQADVIWAQSAEDSPTVAEKDVGIELDGTVKYMVDDNFSIMTGIGYLLTGDFFKASATAPDPDNMMVIVGELSFHF